MSDEPTQVLVDTMIATWVWLQSDRKRATKHLEPFAAALNGKTLLISGQTRAELLVLPLTRKYTPAEVEATRARIDAIPYLPLNHDVQQRYAEITAWGRSGPRPHPIAQLAQAADRWNVATAVAFGLPFASRETKLDGVPGLTFIGPATV